MLQSALLTEDVIVSENVKQLPEMLEGSGMEVVEIRQAAIPFAGREHPGIEVSLNIQDVVVGYERIVVLKDRNYLATVTSFSLDADRAAEGLDFFAAA